MMQTIFFSLCLMIVCSGCAVTMSGPVAPVSSSVLAVEHLKKGMGTSEVAMLMDRPVTVGFEVDPATGASKPIEARSLFSTEILTLGGKSYQIDRYIVRMDNGVAVTNAEALYPVVFEKGLLVAHGHDGLEQLKK